jgi:HlyD family secretion protein
VRQVRDASQTVQNVVIYDAVIDIDNGALKLKPGMTANVTFVVAERPGALRLPNAALRFRPGADVLALAKAAPEKGQGRGARRVFVLDGDRPRPVSVRTGISDGSLTEVLEGPLREGDRVIVDAVAPGARGAGQAQPPAGPPRRIL